MRPPLRLAVFGDPVAHSVSPPMQNSALLARGIDARYTRVHVRPEELAVALARIATAGFIGINLTIPHKTAALPLLDAIDPHAVRLGAVNTVRVETDGSLRGFNTDGPGFVRAVRAEFGMELRGTRVMILGAAGGAGRALATQCVLEGCRGVVLVNRTLAKARDLASTLAERFTSSRCELETIAWEHVACAGPLAGVDLVVNASSVGLRVGDDSPLPSPVIPPGLRVFDTVYRASGEPTPLLAAAREAGANAVGGLSLLLHQGALSFEHWFGGARTARRAMRRGVGACVTQFAFDKGVVSKRLSSFGSQNSPRDDRREGTPTLPK